MVFLHGLLGSSLNFRSICSKPQLTERRDVYSVDLRNHGLSPHSPDLSWAAMASDIAHFLRARRIPRAHLVGHSLGGKVAMATALLHPKVVERLVVVDVAPVDYRVESDAQLAAAAKNARAGGPAPPIGNTPAESSWAVLEAMRLLDLPARTGSDRTALDAALAKLPGMADPFVRGFVLQNCVPDSTIGTTSAGSASASGGGGKATGPWKWRVGLDNLRAGYDTVMTRWPYVGSGGSNNGNGNNGNNGDPPPSTIPHETLFLAGGNSPYLLGREPQIYALCPNAHVQTIPGVGHYVHSQSPAAFLDAVVPFLDEGWTRHVDPATGNAFVHQRSTGVSKWVTDQQ